MGICIVNNIVFTLVNNVVFLYNYKGVPTKRESDDADSRDKSKYNGEHDRKNR
jgi:hypothetical protein